MVAIGVIFCLLYRHADRRLHRLQTQHHNFDFIETYNIFTYRVLFLVKTLIIFELIDVLMLIVQFLSFNHYSTMFEVEMQKLSSEKTSRSIFSQGQRPWYIVFALTTDFFESVITHLLVWCQIFEWAITYNYI